MWLLRFHSQADWSDTLIDSALKWVQNKVDSLSIQSCRKLQFVRLREWSVTTQKEWKTKGKEKKGNFHLD